MGYVGNAPYNGIVNEGNIADNAVTTPKIAPDTVVAADIAAGAVGTSELANDAVTTEKIAAGAVVEADIANSAVTTNKIANSSVTVSKISATGTPGPTNFLRGDGTWQVVSVPVTSVAGRTGDVVLSKTDVGLSNVPNTDTTNASNITSGVLGKARLPSGSVLQVVQTVQRVAYKATWSGWNTCSDHVSATITPLSTSNKILVLVQSNRAHHNYMDAAGIGLYRNNSLLTDSLAQQQGSNRPRLSSAGFMPDNDNSINENIIYLDGPNTTSAVKYTVGIYQSGNYYGGFGIPTNDGDSSNIATTINTVTLIEIAG